MGIDKSEYDVDFRERKEYLSAFFSSLREAGTYMSSENLRVAIESLNMTLSGVKEKEEEENRRIRFEAEQEKARKREELLARVRAKVAKKKADEERAHILEITRMDLPDEWINSFDEDGVIHSESASEALDVCLSELGSVDIEYIAASAGMEINDTLTSLSDRIIQDPLDRGKLTKLRFFAFDLVSDMDFVSKADELRYLDSLGLNTPFHIECNSHNLDATIKQFVPENFQYPVDGLVFEYDDLRYGRSLGATQHHENRLLALKWSDEVVRTVFRGAELSTGRTGKVSITVSFDPVSVCGSTIRRALVSYSRFQELKLGLGDRIGVYKANMIIPQLAENYTLSGTYSLPEICPSCGKPLRLRKTLNGHSELCCANECCLARNSRKIARYADKDAMNISGLSAVIMEKLMSMGWVSTYRDLYHLSDYEDEIINTPGFGIMSYQNMQTSIEKSRVTTLGRFLYSMSIPRLTHSAATSLSKYFHSSFEDFAAAMDSGFQLAEISDVTADIAKSVNDWYWNESSQVLWKLLIKELSFAKSGYHVAGEKHGTCFSDSSIVITGTIPGMTRRQCSEVLNLMGATLTESVSGNTDYLIVGQDPGGVKLAAAMRLGVKIITLDEFLDMLAG